MKAICVVGGFWVIIFFIGIVTDRKRLEDVSIVVLNIYTAALLILNALKTP
jgi:hypothetical protein